MLEPKKILVVTELGAAGAEAVRAGAAQARAHGAELAVVHAIPALHMVRPVFPERVADDALRQAILPERVRLAIDQHLQAAAPDAPVAEVFLESGSTAEVALAVAGRWGADLVVVGAPGDGALDGTRILRHADVPVLFARSGPRRGAILACTDFSDPALPAVHAAAAEAGRTEDPLCVVHALEPVPAALIGVEGHGIIQADEWLRARRAAAERRLADALAATNARGEYLAVDGPVVSTLAAVARERAARLLVIGTVGRTGLTRFLLGSVAEALVGVAPCSVLVVRLRRGGT